MDKERLRDLLLEATADCHDEDEQFWSIFYTLETRLRNIAQNRGTDLQRSRLCKKLAYIWTSTGKD